MSSTKLVIIDNDQTSRATLKNQLEHFDNIIIKGEFDNILEGCDFVLKEQPQIILIDISKDTNTALELINKISIQHKSGFVIAMAEENSTDLVIKAMRAGSREFLKRPIDPLELKQALEKSTKRIDDSSTNKKCEIFTIFSNKGGIGKTALATNLALNLANITGERVALVDLNLQLGDVTTFLDLNPSFDISYVASNLNRVDESFLLGTLEKYKNKNLYILADPPYLEQAEDISAEQISTLIEALKSHFSYVVIDTSSNFDGKTLSALDVSDQILLISMVNLPSIRNAQRCMDLFNRLGYSSEKIKLTINRYMPDDEIQTEDVEEVLNHPIFWKIPNNYFAMMSSINKGIPVTDLNPTSNVAQSFKELAAILSNTVIIKEKDDTIVKKQSFIDTVKNFFVKNKTAKN